MKTGLRILAFVMLFFSGGNISAQQFKNGGLEDEVTHGDFKCGYWTNVPFKDPVCQATGKDWATPDLLSENGPDPSYGMAGKPHSGKTFASGNHAFITGDMFQEGIMQEVSGFVPGEKYKVTFYQAVIKQDNLLDTSGSWAVYFDNTLAGISAPSISHVATDDRDKTWEQREIFFVATKESHWIKFLPMDDDNDHDSNDGERGGLRMGIDDISLSATPTLNIVVTEGPISKMLLVKNPVQDTITVNVNDVNGKPVMKLNSFKTAESVVDLMSLSTGTFEVEFRSGNRSYVKEVVVK